MERGAITEAEASRPPRSFICDLEAGSAFTTGLLFTPCILKGVSELTRWLNVVAS